jgi:hypothetical protein
MWAMQSSRGETRPTRYQGGRATEGVDDDEAVGAVRSGERERWKRESSCLAMQRKQTTTGSLVLTCGSLPGSDSEERKGAERWNEGRSRTRVEMS